MDGRHYIYKIARRQNCDMNRFFRAPLVLMAWQQLFLFFKAAQHGPAPFVACFRGCGLCKLQGL